ncbi:hypothetical protein CEE69_12850 [Rhodopirellula bahusiensis]|uniref:Uncharacterized protein n=1 Tax=Rhodopirellula bahusiensis TaxID=2014065 RepID=A0A2G1W6X8_9BACT|nr:hypothetical protein CEE69_12850 [Rhodopirellula bahusiensis]
MNSLFKGNISHRSPAVEVSSLGSLFARVSARGTETKKQKVGQASRLSIHKTQAGSLRHTRKKPAE